MKKSNSEWNVFLLLVMAGTVLLWIWQAITWPFRVIRRWLGCG